MVCRRLWPKLINYFPFRLSFNTPSRRSLNPPITLTFSIKPSPKNAITRAKIPAMIVTPRADTQNTHCPDLISLISTTFIPNRLLTNTRGKKIVVVMVRTSIILPIFSIRASVCLWAACIRWICQYYRGFGVKSSDVLPA
jgi:hypothetical protein